MRFQPQIKAAYIRIYHGDSRDWEVENRNPTDFTRDIASLNGLEGLDTGAGAELGEDVEDLDTGAGAEFGEEVEDGRLITEDLRPTDDLLALDLDANLERTVTPADARAATESAEENMSLSDSPSSCLLRICLSSSPPTEFSNLCSLSG